MFLSNKFQVSNKKKFQQNIIQDTAFKQFLWSIFKILMSSSNLQISEQKLKSFQYFIFSVLLFIDISLLQFAIYYLTIYINVRKNLYLHKEIKPPFKREKRKHSWNGTFLLPFFRNICHTFFSLDRKMLFINCMCNSRFLSILNTEIHSYVKRI